MILGFLISLIIGGIFFLFSFAVFYGTIEQASGPIPAFILTTIFFVAMFRGVWIQLHYNIGRKKEKNDKRKLDKES